LARTDRAHSDEYRSMARGIAAECGIDLAAFAQPAPASPATAPVTVRCLGRFSITIEGTPADLAPVKPRVRQLLRLLALHAGRPVHRETIVEALWPESDPDTGMRKLQVAVSSLRQILPAPAGGSLVERDDDAYLLALPPDADVDFVSLAAAVAAGDRARSRGDPAAAVSHYRRALDLCTGELLEEVGPADWALAERERTKSSAARAALSLAELLLAAGDPAGAAGACQKGLAIDRYRDTLWRRLIEALEWAEGPAAATVARARYAEMLADLGVPGGTLVPSAQA
ncbi:MAG: AfsR/SARP family transcriptional regulator, partial [Actinomycetota bacterium]